MKLKKGMWLVKGLELTRITSIGPKQTGLQHFAADYSFRKRTDLLESDVDAGNYTVVTPESVEFITCRREYQKREARYIAGQMRSYELSYIMVSEDDYFATTKDYCLLTGGDQDEDEDEAGR